MNFAVPFKRDFKYLDDENLQFNIRYKPEKEKLKDFIEKYKNHRINFQIGEQNFYTCVKIIRDLKEEIPESSIVVAIDHYISKKEIDTLYETNIPFYFLKTVSNLDEFHHFLKLKVSDIIIGGDLGFYIKFLSKIAKKNNIHLRAIVDFCQSYDSLSSIKSFFIRPEDIDVYSNYIDTFDFMHPKDRINTIYEIYAKDKKWYGQLKEIIMGYKGEEDSRFILPPFAEIRCGCKKRCLYDIKNTCKICDRIIQLGEALKKSQEEEIKNEQESN